MSKDIRHFVNMTDIPAETLKGILKQAHALKAEKFSHVTLMALWYD